MDDISTIRRRNVRKLIAEQFSNNQSRFAEVIGKKEAQVNQIVGPTPTRNIGSALAREIEEKTGIEKNSLDQAYSGSLNPQILSRALDIAETAIKQEGVSDTKEMRRAIILLAYRRILANNGNAIDQQELVRTAAEIAEIYM